MKKIKVYHFNTHLFGGAATAAKRLFDSLLQFEDLDLRFYSKSYSSDIGYFQYKDIQTEPVLNRIKNQLPFLEDQRHEVLKDFDKYLQGRPAGLESFDRPRQFVKTSVPKPFPDIIHLHWVSNFLDYESFFKQIPPGIPIVWTLHDMNAFTGGCHYTNGCNKFVSICESCPQLGPYSKTDLAKYGFQVKEAAFSGKKIHVAADSEWLKERAAESSLLKNATSIRCIHYGLDHLVFTPKDKNSCRNALGIEVDEDEFVICFGADGINNKRKGMQELQTAIDILNSKGVKITCLIFGDGEPGNSSHAKVISFGRVSSTLLLSIIYNAADLFVMPSLEEAFGQTSLEAISCGVPVVAFDTGGIPDMIVNNQTGLLAQAGNADDLAEKILDLLQEPELRKSLSVHCRNKVLEQFTLEHQASKYRGLYQEALSA